MCFFEARFGALDPPTDPPTELHGIARNSMELFRDFAVTGQKTRKVQLKTQNPAKAAEAAIFARIFAKGSVRMQNSRVEPFQPNRARK